MENPHQSKYICREYICGYLDCSYDGYQFFTLICMYILRTPPRGRLLSQSNQLNQWRFLMLTGSRMACMHVGFPAQRPGPWCKTAAWRAFEDYLRSAPICWLNHNGQSQNRWRSSNVVRSPLAAQRSQAHFPTVCTWANVLIFTLHLLDGRSTLNHPHGRFLQSLTILLAPIL